MDTHVLFRTHYASPQVERYWRHLQDTSGSYPVRMMADVTRGACPEWALRFSESDVIAAGFSLRDYTAVDPLYENRLYANPEYGTLIYSLWHDFDYVWTLDYDCYFSGEWSEFFDHFAGVDDDFLGLFVRPLRDDGWIWWNAMDTGSFHDHRMASYGPVYRLSRRACGLLRQQARAQDYGFIEVAMPTVINAQGWRVSDINAHGRSWYDHSTIACTGLRPDNLPATGFLHHAMEH